MDRCKEILAANNITKRFQLYKLFSVNDADGSYSLTRDELVKMFSSQLKTDLTNDEVDAIFKAVDVNGDGEVTLKEWVSILFPESS
jgi:Ca2+-binding EF-hand superfamily protein